MPIPVTPPPQTAERPVEFQATPGQYRHWNLVVEGEVATLGLDVQEDSPLREGYKLKLNSYDLGVDIELADALNRIRFEHPEVRVVVVKSLKPRMFCAGANIYMLGSSSHPFKVNFCKFTNETRCAMEEASRFSGIRFVAALNGTCAGGGYELALACDAIYLVDDGSSAVSLPEVPLLGVLPGTGGLTRLVDKRKVRRDRADVFCTLAEGIKGKRAKEWGLIDDTFPTSKFDQAVTSRIDHLLAEIQSSPSDEPSRSTPPKGIKLHPLEVQITESGREYRYVSLQLNRKARIANLTLRAPADPQPDSAVRIQEWGDRFWALAAYRELDDALLHLRFNEPEIGLVIVRTHGEIDAIHRIDEMLSSHRDHGLVREIILHMGRVLRRMDHTAKSFFALIEEGSCFAGNLLELALASDRTYMRNDPDQAIKIATTSMNAGALPMSNGLSRLESRFLNDNARIEAALKPPARFSADAALEGGLVTLAPDGLDWDDEIRVAIEERTSLSPDALTGMEASLRFAGPETTETKIYGRLTAWQNWIFQRPNAVGEHGGLTNYGKPTKAKFDFRRT
ncbi:MAG: 2,3-epoxybenzoyl-CoA dihydrolase [Acidobacteriia bacterium]|nr:2,3-epoxybenzoyl-CoA dihydrolase [Terriglobia bacterium]